MICAVAVGAFAVPLVAAAGRHQENDITQDEAIQYAKSAPNDSISHLQRQIDSGEIKLQFDPGHGWLTSVLKALKLKTSSQTLVFSKTSFQRDLIDPESPRALYFNDTTYIGWVQGGRVLEALAVDPKLGPNFYVLDQHAASKPHFVRQTDECLECHASTLTSGIPGCIMRSVYPAPDGQPVLTEGTHITTDESPMSERWGGWYVTGTSGSQTHMGNQLFRQSTPFDLEKGTNVTDLRRFLNTAPYLSWHSDIVALMVMEHQTHVQNLMTEAGYRTRVALRYEQALNKELNRPANYRSESTTSRIKSVCEPLVRALLFAGEPPLTAPVAGTSTFALDFSAAGPKDHLGRSLRDLDLTHRLFRYPCSYLIYSDAFTALPPEARDYVYKRLAEVLTGKDTSPTFARLTVADRRAILEILRDTKPDFAASYSSPGGAL